MIVRGACRALRRSSRSDESCLRGNRHVRFAEGTPLTNLYLTLLGKLDVPAERVGDSTGRLAELSDV